MTSMVLSGRGALAAILSRDEAPSNLACLALEPDLFLTRVVYDHDQHREPKSDPDSQFGVQGATFRLVQSSLRLRGRFAGWRPIPVRAFSASSTASCRECRPGSLHACAICVRGSAARDRRCGTGVARP